MSKFLKNRNFKWRALLSAAFILFASTAFFYPHLSAAEIRRKFRENISAAPDSAPTPRRTKKQARNNPRRARYSEFPHNVKAHQAGCNSCHKFPSANWKSVRKTGEAFPDITEYPRHESCLNCHRQQFFKGNPPQICSICHTNPGPRNDSPRHLFPNPREIFDLSAKGKNHISDFQIFLPHDKHIEIVSRLNDEKTIFRSAVFTVSKTVKGEESCAVCHQTYQPQNDSNEEFAVKPPVNLGNAFWLKKGTFKTAPISHAKCFECHNADAGILPAQTNCATCHKFQTPPPKTDFDAKAVAPMKITDKITLAAWRKRDSSAKFRHEFSSHAELECANCHTVRAMNTTDFLTKKVPVSACNLCHITATTDDGGILNYEIDERKKNAGFQCVKCHLAFGKLPIPDSHFKAVKAAQ